MKTITVKQKTFKEISIIKTVRCNYIILHPYYPMSSYTQVFATLIVDDNFLVIGKFNTSKVIVRRIDFKYLTTLNTNDYWVSSCNWVEGANRGSICVFDDSDDRRGHRNVMSLKVVN